MSEDEEGGDMGRPADGVLFRPLPIPDVAWMLDRVPVMGEDDRSGVTGPAGTRINADVRRTNTEELDEPEEREKETRFGGQRSQGQPIACGLAFTRLI
jgi:hypothetical protein